MKKLTKGLLAAGTLIAATSAAAFVDSMCPLVGVDFQQVWMKGKEDISNLAPKSYPGANVYVGTRLCEYLGLELGWDWAAKKSKNFTEDDGTTGKLNVRRQGGHLDLFTYIPVADCFELMFGPGVGYVNAKSQFVFNDGTPSENYKPKGAVGRIRLGGSYTFNECIGARVLVGWESTSNLSYKTRVANHKVYPFQDSITAAVGLFYKF